MKGNERAGQVTPIWRQVLEGLIRFRLLDGSLVTEKKLSESHRIPHGSAATRMPQLLLRGKT